MACTLLLLRNSEPHVQAFSTDISYHDMHTRYDNVCKRTEGESRCCRWEDHEVISAIYVASCTYQHVRSIQNMYHCVSLQHCRHSVCLVKERASLTWLLCCQPFSVPSSFDKFRDLGYLGVLSSWSGLKGYGLIMWACELSHTFVRCMSTS